MSKEFNLAVTIDDGTQFTHKPYPNNSLVATQQAEHFARSGIWDNGKLYPPHRILDIEIKIHEVK